MLQQVRYSAPSELPSSSRWKLHESRQRTQMSIGTKNNPYNHYTVMVRKAMLYQVEAAFGLCHKRLHCCFLSEFYSSAFFSINPERVVVGVQALSAVEV